MSIPGQPLQTTDDVIEKARRFATSGWRPTHQEIQQLLQHIDDLTDDNERLRGETLGYARASREADGEWWVEGDSDQFSTVQLYGATPFPFEIGEGQTVVTVIRRVLP